MTTDHQGAEALADVILRAILKAPHIITKGRVVLEFDRSKAGHNALNQLSEHIREAVEAWNRRPAPASDLRAAAQAVVDRWDSPQWKDEPHTAEFINRLRRALEAVGGDGLPELPSYWAALVLNKHGEVVSRIEPSADGVVPGTVESFDRAWPGLAPHRIAITFTADQMRQYALDALAAAKVPQWLPIEQAPKDGTPVLVHQPHARKRVQEAFWATPWEDAPEEHGHWMTPIGVAGRGYTILPEAVTHFMPLPAPPSDSAAEGDGEGQA